MEWIVHALLTGYGFVMCFSTRYSKSFPLETVICSHYIQTGSINCIYSHSCPGGGPTEAWLPICTSKHHHHPHRAFTHIHVWQSVSPKDTATETWFKPPLQWLLECQTFQPDELFVYLSTHLYVWLSCCACLLRMRSNQICWIKLQYVVSGTQPEQSRHFFFRKGLLKMKEKTF